jgi:mono/diheme cytochrome c family protein
VRSAKKRKEWRASAKRRLPFCVRLGEDGEMKKRVFGGIAAGGVWLVGLAGAGAQEGPGASVVPAGDPARGEQIFLEKQCFRCHTLEGKRLPDFDLPASLKLHLGGETHRSWSRDAFAQAIMNPEHVVAPAYQAAMLGGSDPKAAGETPMPNFNRELTVSELIDLATFLDGATR